MLDFLTCVAIEQSGYWSVGVVTFFAVLIISLEVLCIRLFWTLLKTKLADFEIRIGDKMLLNTKGAGTAIVVFAFAVLLPVTPAGAAWYLYHNFQDYYAVHVDAEADDTLESLRAELAQESRTHVAILLADNLKDFRVRGEFEGICVADLVEALCRAHPTDLRCTRSYENRTITVNPP